MTDNTINDKPIYSGIDKPTFMKIRDEDNFIKYATFFIPFIYNPYYTMIRTKEGHLMEYFDYIGYNFAKYKSEELKKYHFQHRVAGVSVMTVLSMRYLMKGFWSKAIFGPLTYFYMSFLMAPDLIDSLVYSNSSLWIEEFGNFFVCKKNREEE